MWFHNRNRKDGCLFHDTERIGITSGRGSDANARRWPKRSDQDRVPEQPPPVSDRPPDLAELVEALRPIVRRGLPVTPEVADDRLLALRGVWARSIDPDDRLYRVRGLDRLLREVLTDYPNDEGLGEAARTLFGLTEGVVGPA